MRPYGHGAIVAHATSVVNRIGPMTDIVRGQRAVATAANAVAHSATDAPAAIPRW